MTRAIMIKSRVSTAPLKQFSVEVSYTFTSHAVGPNTYWKKPKTRI